MAKEIPGRMTGKSHFGANVIGVIGVLTRISGSSPPVHAGANAHNKLNTSAVEEILINQNKRQPFIRRTLGLEEHNKLWFHAK